MSKNQFPNGFTSWQETHYEVVSFLTLSLDREDDPFYEIVSKIVEEWGVAYLKEYASNMTDKFEKLHYNRNWDGEFFEELESFMLQELKKL